MADTERDIVLISELIGRPSRCYTVGDMVTEDFVEDRVNIVLEKDGRIHKIWFG